MKKMEVVWVDKDKCVGSNMCENCCSRAFKVEDQLAHVIGQAISSDNVVPNDKLPKEAELVLMPTGLEIEVHQAAEECPYFAILIEEIELLDPAATS